jgi:hypothetical protein
VADDGIGRLVRAFREHSTCGATNMNLQAALPSLDQAPAIPADDPITRMLADARLSDEGSLLDAVEARRVELGLSLATLDRLAGLAVGHASKCLSPARLKRPSTGTLYALLDALALSVVLLVDPAKAARISPSWRPRNEAKVRDRALSPTALERARPVILAELARKASRPRWASMPARNFLRAVVEQSQ